MKYIKVKLIVFLLSSLFLAIFLLFFKPILFADSLVFPYSVHPFDIVKDYPKTWLYIKIVYVVNLYTTVFLIVNSISIHVKFNKIHIHKTNSNINKNNIQKNSSFNLLIGSNCTNNESIYLSEKGLYQNILVTGTIGSRKNKFCYVSASKPNN